MSRLTIYALVCNTCERVIGSSSREPFSDDHHSCVHCSKKIARIRDALMPLRDTKGRFLPKED